MPRDDGNAKARILAAAVKVLLTHPPERVTLELVARTARCAKGLIHYHFKTKEALLAAGAAEIWGARTGSWRAALAHPNPSEAIDRAWDLIAAEADSGAHHAAVELASRGNDLIGRTARQAAVEFRQALAVAVQDLVERMGRRLTVPAEEAGELLVSTVTGLGLELAMGADRDRVGAAWAAFWVGLLGLSR